MITFTNGLDIRTRLVDKIQVAKFIVKSTNPDTPDELRYIVIGTEYGHLHTTSGDLATWKTYSGAYKALMRY